MKMLLKASLNESTFENVSALNKLQHSLHMDNFSSLSASQKEMGK